MEFFVSGLKGTLFKTHVVNLIISIILLSIITDFLEHYWLRNIVIENTKAQQHGNLVRIANAIEQRYQNLILQNNRELESLVSFSRKYSGSTEQLDKLFTMFNQALSGQDGDYRKISLVNMSSATQPGVIASSGRNGKISPFTYVINDSSSNSSNNFTLKMEKKVRKNLIIQVEISGVEIIRELGLLNIMENNSLNISIHTKDAEPLFSGNHKINSNKKESTHISSSQMGAIYQKEIYQGEIWQQALKNPITNQQDFDLIIEQSHYESANLSLKSALIELLFFSLFVTVLGAAIIGYIFISRVLHPIRKFNHLTNKQGIQTKIFSEVNDIEDASKELEISLSKHSEERTIDSLDRLLTNLSHHLNTPLSINVVTSSNILEISNGVRNKLQQGKMKKSELFSFLDNLALNVAEQQIATDKVLNHLERIGRVAAITSTGALQPLDKVVSDTLVVYQSKIADKKIRIHLDSPPPGINVDGHSIHRILCNLIENSLEHAFLGRETGSVFIKFEEINGCVSLYYHDDGVGLPESQLNSIFQPFSNCSKVGTRLGLGMYEIYTIVSKNLDGQIAAEPGPCDGLAFKIEFGVI